MNRRSGPGPEGSSIPWKAEANKKNTRSISTPVLIFIVAFLVTAVPLIYLTFFTHFFDSIHLTGLRANTRNNFSPPSSTSSPIIHQKVPNSPLTVPEHLTIRQPPINAASPLQTVNIPQPTETRDIHQKTVLLPGAAGHSILTLSEDEVRNRGIDELMAPYGEADGGGSCAQDFGNMLVNRWRGTKRAFCPRTTNAQSNQLSSNIDCYLVHQTRHHGNGDNLCKMENVAVDMSIFDDDRTMRPVIETYVKTRHARQAYPPFPVGWLQGDCEPDKSMFKDMYMPGWNADLVTRPFQSSTASKEEICSEWIEHTVLLQERDTFANFFHDSEDFVNVFLAMAILRIKPKDMQVFLMDLYPKGPFWEMWSEVYSHPLPTLTAWDLKKRFPRKADGSPNYVCFKSLVTGIYGPAAPTTIASWDTPCTKTALVRAYSDFVIRSLGLQSFTHYAQASPSRTITITYMSRKASKEWPEKKYCDDNNSFFLCKYWENFGSRQLGRMVSNDDAVVRALKELENPSHAIYRTFPQGTSIKVQAVDYNVLSFKEQIKIDLETDVMIGPHGAGLMHNIFMRDRAVLVELFVDGSSANRHFHNLAHWYGRPYDGRPINNPINTNELMNIVKENIRKVNINSY